MSRDTSLLSSALIRALFSEINVNPHGAKFLEGQVVSFHKCKNANEKITQTNKNVKNVQ